MKGLSNTTAAAIREPDHLAQSVRDILTTPVGSRVMRRDYGSRIPELIDQPLTGALRLQVFAEVVEALARWEPRIQVERLELTPQGPTGRAVLTLEARILAGGRLTTEVPL